MSILSNHFDNLILSVFTDEELKQLPPLELNERKMMFVAGANLVMTILEYTEDEIKLETSLVDVRNEIDNFVKLQLKK